jgi:hypothetical protein
MNDLYTTLHAEGTISDESYEKIRQQGEVIPLFSLHWELKTLLYIGVVLLTAGLGKY